MKFSEHPIVNLNPTFKNWRKPGPIPDLERAESLELLEDESLDGFCGHYRIVQLKAGHRFSTDDLLCAWYATAYAPAPRQVLDLGSGIGTVALCMAWRLSGARFVTVEAQSRSVELAKKSIAFNGLEDRFDVHCGDFREVGLGPEFDLVTGSPPYFPVTDALTPEHPQKVACRFELRGDISTYVEVAKSALAPGGWFVCVFPLNPEHQKQRVFDAARDHGMNVVRWRRVSLQEGNDHDIGLFAMMRSEDTPISTTVEEPTLIIRHEDRSLSDDYRALKMSFGFPPTD